jgi:hypothetical protein
MVKLNPQAKVSLAARAVSALSVLLVLTDISLAQTLRVTASQPPASSGGSSLPWIVIALVIGCVIAWIIRGKLEKASADPPLAVDGRPARDPRDRQPNDGWQPGERRSRSEDVPVERRKSTSKAMPTVYEPAERERILAWIEKIIRENKVDVSVHPVFSITTMPSFEPYASLDSVDDPLLNIAIRNASDENQPDITVRQDAIEVLATFRTPESIEALSQIALYDISSEQRSLALTILGEFDHPSVLLPIILAMGDPTREIRAAASRALNRVTFCRSNEWLRIAQSDDQFLVNQCARAVASVGFAKHVLPRLVNSEGDSMMEALGIVALLVRGSETDDMLDLLRSGSDKLVARALLHALQLTGDVGIMKKLISLLESQEIAKNIQPNVERIVEEYALHISEIDPGHTPPHHLEPSPVVASNLPN